MIKGVIKVIKETEQITDSFKKRVLVVTEDGKYPQDIAVEFVQDKTDDLNAYKVGDRVDVEYNRRGREYNGNYYVNLNGWKISKTETANASTSNNEPQVEDFVDEESNDLPF